MSLSELHAAARTFASNGVPVFPCYARTKVPATKTGFHEATTDLSIIDKWWTEDPNYNPAFCPHMAGLGVVDIDGQAGEENWANWQIEHGEAPPTYEIKTPRGGRHLYFHGVLPATQSKVADHIDTRGVGSYVLAPPSVVVYPDGSSGTYAALNSRPPADLPAVLPDFLRQLQKAHTKAAVDDLDLPANVARAERLLKDYVARGHVAIEGQMGDGRTYAVACEVLNLGLSPEKAMDLLEDIWNPACQPPWETDELLVKVENASRYSQNEAGAWAVEPTTDVFARALDKLTADPPPAPPTSRFRAYTLEEIGALPPPEWLVPDMIPANSLTLFYGAPSSYKSFVVLDQGLELAALGRTVVYIGAEGGRGLEIRAAAWKLVNRIEGPLPFYIVTNMPWASDGSMMAEFIEGVKAQGIKPDLVVIDTAARMMVGLNENDARDVGMFVAAVDTIRTALKTTVAIIHHTGKDAGRGARGSGALEAATDAAFEIKADKATRAVAMWCRRQKDAQEREMPWTWEGKDVAGSLVFQRLPYGDYQALTRVDDALVPKKIGKVLRELGAIKIENGVTTHVLAQQLVPPDEEMSDESRAVYVAQTSRMLSKKAKGPLEAYCSGSGPDALWFVV